MRVRLDELGASWPNGYDVGLSTRGSTWVRIPAKARRGICEQDTINPQLGSVKKNKKKLG
jgi:hypothetical protein